MVFMHCNNISEIRLTNAQDKVMANYAKKLSLTDLEQQHLHMFFSPFRVPKGLTKLEINQIIWLSRGIHLPSAFVSGTGLPRDWKSGKTMTRGIFRKGLQELLTTLVKVDEKGRIVLIKAAHCTQV